jgi:hypothetical protein
MQWAGDIIFSRVPSSSFRVRQSSVGCCVAQKGAAFYEGRNLAQRVQLISSGAA